VSFPLLLAIGALLNGVASLLAFRRGSVNRGGALAGLVVGTLIFACGGPLFWLVLMLFFVSSTALGYVRARDKVWLQAVHQKGGRRDMLQVIANGGVGAACAVLYLVMNNAEWAVAFAVSFAASNADTWGSEIGVLSRHQPISLLTLRSVPRGVSGGVSLLGSGMALGGSFFIATAFAVANLAGRFLPPALVPLTLFVTAAGFAGSLVDSILGATLQAQYAAPAPSLSDVRDTLAITERATATDGTPNRLVRGLPFITNDVVNLASCAIVTGAAAILWPLVGGR